MSDEKIVEGEFVDGPPPGRRPPEPASSGTFFHPLSGAVILGLDWLAFGMEWATGFLGVAVVSVGVFALTYSLVYKVQTVFAKDSSDKARLKALLGAIAAAVPFPITGTVVGAAILALSGLSSILKLPRK